MNLRVRGAGKGFGRWRPTVDVLWVRLPPPAQTCEGCTRSEWSNPVTAEQVE